MPSYEERLIQMEAILKNSVTLNFYGEKSLAPRFGLSDLHVVYINSLRIRTPSAEILKELSDSQYTVYDVLPAFFSHRDPVITLGLSDYLFVATNLIPQAAALEVYVRRAYHAYTLLLIDYEEGDGLDDGEVPCVVTWCFNLGQSHSPPSTPRLFG